MKKILLYLFLTAFAAGARAQHITGGEYFIDTAPTLGSGTAFTVNPADEITHSLTIPVASLNNGFHTLFIRVKNNENVWSHYEGRIFYIIMPLDMQPQLVSGEWFIDNDPGLGAGTAIAFGTANAVNHSFTINTEDMEPGFHTLFIRVKNSNGVWSHYEGRVFYIMPQTTLSPQLVAGEWFVDEDPGLGNGTAITFEAANSVNPVLDISTAGLEPGTHHLFIRIQDAAGTWSLYEGREFIVCPDDIPLPTALPQTYCIGATVNDLSAEGNEIKWYATDSGGSPLTPETILQTGNYYVSQMQETCESERLEVAVTINDTEEPEATAQQFCDTATVAELIPAGSGIQWYDSETATTALETSSLLTSGTYYVSQTADGCESSRVAVEVIIVEPTVPEAMAQQFCDSATVADLTPSGEGIQWYESETATGALTGTTLLANGTYYVSQTTSDCESSRVSVVVTIIETTAPEAIAQQLCSNATVADLVPSGTGIQWYDSNTATIPLESSTILTDGTYYVSQITNGCESPRIDVAVSIIESIAPEAEEQQFCNSAMVADLSPSGEGIQWYDSGTATEALVNEAQLENGTYYVSQTIDGCESSRTSVEITIQAVNATVTEEGGTLTAVLENADYQWMDCNDGQTPIEGAQGQSFTPESSGSYAVMVTVENCSLISECITVDVAGNTNFSNPVHVMAYPNPASSIIYIEGNFQEEVSFLLTDMAGKQIMKNNNPPAGKYQLDLGGIAEGIYILSIKSGTQVYTKKISIVQQ